MNTNFSSLSSYENLCSAWQTYGAINEDRTVVFTSAPDDRCNFLNGDNPLDKLRDLLKRFTLTPMFETCGGHFGRMLTTHFGDPTHIEMLAKEGQIFDKVMGGWVFSGNFEDLSCGFSVYVADRELARELLELISDNYAKGSYKEAVNRKYRNHYGWNGDKDYQNDCFVYFNENKKHFCVSRPGDEENLPITEETAKNLRRGRFLLHAFLGAERIGPRSEVDYSTLLKEKLEDILK